MGTASLITSTWSNIDRRATVALHDEGNVSYSVYICNGDLSDSYSMSGYHFDIELLVAEGMYFIQNKQTENYMQIDKDEAPDYSSIGAVMEQWSLSGEDCQRWEFVHIVDGYYKILSVESGLALCLASNSVNENKAALVQQTYTDTARKQWQITKSATGNYVFRPKSAEAYTTDWCMRVKSDISGMPARSVLQQEYVDDSNYLDEWVCVRMLPTNGSELAYSPSMWSGAIKNYCNCYAYALNNQVFPGTNWLWVTQQPGEYCDYRSTQSQDSAEEDICDAVAADYDMYNEDFDKALTFRSIERYEACPAGTYKVALVASESDYHWYRQDADGLWSHKPGTNAVKRTDASGELIIDPYIADRGDYTQFLGYYAVTPWNEMRDLENLFYCFCWGDQMPYSESLEGTDS